MKDKKIKKLILKKLYNNLNNENQGYVETSVLIKSLDIKEELAHRILELLLKDGKIEGNIHELYSPGFSNGIDSIEPKAMPQTDLIRIKSSGIDEIQNNGLTNFIQQHVWQIVATTIAIIGLILRYKG